MIRQRRELLVQRPLDPRRLGEQILALDDVEVGESGRCGGSVPAVGVTVERRTERPSAGSRR
jgi:hypothetical protein